MYQINKGINRPIEFKGIKAQYISYFAVGLVLILLLFIVLYISGVSIYLTLGITLPVGIAFYLVIQHYSGKYGETGLLKRSLQQKSYPKIKTGSRTPFLQLSLNDHAEDKTTGAGLSNLEN
ncbi:DUF4133 domain-containing protein [Paraflavitalea sp. CAU 1676]|uniref:DUF4133 domain-containing protein n=1 Tax=Paraflavitalea sp. CAU 1676 TaxID=3032598 RepID=UPI0023DB32AE|nr:DUF4133 domain-containing protein [Paraflavitalea sp. CAU 1676]MDF2191364.1 DUF4133 domain-containing protein [Paraflavitalea sp. CAU 1676]